MSAPPTVNLLVMMHKMKHLLQDKKANPSDVPVDGGAIYQFKYDNAKVGGRFDPDRPLTMHKLKPKEK